ncbi:restriction endonuclease subunit S [Streptococcus thermophilus]|jgi:type I restriction enzyme, S subunit|uniref:restriction endonuclease subunit S n=1 Tax=Streptococcus thermophilus TaxID=1308 RepID=UPI001C652DDC|nr:restriction endonuclease subunit S [Streptococcus thermophilus]MBW7819008.1 restriction endonuclease subunit S [Streptococcus thermophilus]MCE2155090.1 restriction endonuclease subunit S [Streptococcus thermophilus]
MSEWKFLTLKEAELEFIDGDRGVNYPKKSELLPEGDCVFLNTGNVRQNSFDFSNLDFITKEKDNLLRNGKLQRDDIVLTTRGTVGNVALYSQEVPFSNIRINSGMVIIRVNKNFWHPYFIYLFFQSHLFKKQISRLISGSAQPQLPISILETVNIPQLTLDEQKEIIFNIKSIDQKIQINNQINQELEAMAKTLYDYWFVQFDFPDENGKPYKSSGGKMVYNDQLKREIPEGWGVAKVEDIAQTGSGGTPKSTNVSYYSNGEIPWINSGELEQTVITSTSNFITEEGLNNSSAKLFPSGTILVAMYGATAGKVSFLTFEASTNQAICAIMLNDIRMRYYLKNVIEDLYQYLVKLSTGSARDNLSQDMIKNIKVVIPSNDILDRYYDFSNNIIKEITKKQQENEQLTQLRDWLLPMLMNGQVKV